MKLCQMVVPREEDESEGVDALMRAARARASPGRSHTCQDTVRQDVYGRRTGGVVQIRRERHSEDDERVTEDGRSSEREAGALRGRPPRSNSSITTSIAGDEISVAEHACCDTCVIVEPADRGLERHACYRGRRGVSLRTKSRVFVEPLLIGTRRFA